MSDRENRFEDLISRQIDGQLSVDEHQELQRWINADPANAKLFVEYSLLHDGLHQELEDDLLQNSKNHAGEMVSPPGVWFRTRGIQWIGGSIAALLLMGLFLIPFFTGATALAAEEQLERLIAVSKAAADRSYVVTAIESNKKSRRTEFQSRKKKKQPPIDGAILHIRGETEYVLIRRFANGDQFITGCDGEQSWAVPPYGKVRVSQNLDKFQGALPGNQHAIPFINVQQDLRNIRDAYHIRWLDSETESRRNGTGCLVAEKKSPEFRGAKYIEIWFDRESGTITEILFDKLPRAKGGPQSIVLELTDQTNLASGFFRHEAHHNSEREVVYERD